MTLIDNSDWKFIELTIFNRLVNLEQVRIDSLFEILLLRTAA